MQQVTLKAEFLTQEHFEVFVFDELGNLLATMVMPIELWRREEARNAFIEREFMIEAERMIRCN